MYHCGFLSVNLFFPTYRLPFIIVTLDVSKAVSYFTIVKFNFFIGYLAFSCISVHILLIAYQEQWNLSFTATLWVLFADGRKTQATFNVKGSINVLHYDGK